MPWNPKGHRTPGSGRKKGGLSKKTLGAMEAISEAYGKSCIQEMIDMVEAEKEVSPRDYKKNKFQLLTLLLPYCHAKPSPSDPNTPPPKPEEEVLDGILASSSVTNDRPKNPS